MSKQIEQLQKEIERLKKELKKKKKYGLVWEDKPEDVVEMCKEKLPVLKEVKNKEIITDKDKPVNLLIEGDNYHALSVLNYTHTGKVDVIYIDPPYNTGNKDFIFNDHYVDREDAYRHADYVHGFQNRRITYAGLRRDTARGDFKFKELQYPQPFFESYFDFVYPASAKVAEAGKNSFPPFFFLPTRSVRQAETPRIADALRRYGVNWAGQLAKYRGFCSKESSDIVQQTPPY